ncbi:MAG: thiamine pyrophosphate-dependent enzyme, partial [Lachnospiraceae bacterium]|nr:thiamine pyrophosphate-dependent enzyme [Lachnospiraceae bacterium]
DVTKDVTGAVCDFQPEEIKATEPSVSYTKEELEQVLALLKEAKKPFVLVGGGAVLSNAWQEVREFVARFNAPVCDTLMGKGVIDGNMPEYTGMIGMHGTKASDLGVSECDCLVALGARFSDRITGDAKRFASGAKIIQIDIDAAEINKNVRTTASLVGDLKLALRDILASLDQQDHRDWLAFVEELKQKYPLKYEQDQLSCPYIIQEIDRITEGQALITTDVGQHQMWAAQYYTFTEPRTLLTSGGLGTMGYGLGACIGAKMARPEKLCINIAGDGCFRMNMNELATASRYNIPVIEVVINNHVLGMVRQWQTLFYGKRYSQTVLNDCVDFCKVAEGLGCEAIRVTTKEEVEPAIRRAISLGRPVVIDCIIPEDDKVLPMVPAGAPISEAFDGDDLKEREQ